MNGHFRRLVRQVFTVARRDFVATVFTPAFLLFLLAPMVMASFATIGGVGAQNMASVGEDQERVVAIIAPERAATMKAVDERLRDLYRQPQDAPATLRMESPRGDAVAQARALFQQPGIEVGAVLYGPLERPQVLYAPRYGRSARYMVQLAEGTLRVEDSGGLAPLARATLTEVGRDVGQTTAGGRGAMAFFAVVILFVLMLLLAGQAVGTMAEERSNKVIEVLAAAVPLESVFLGKLVGMFGVACMFLAFWAVIVTQVSALLPPDFVAVFSGVGPAVGRPAFVLLFLAYFLMGFLLLGAVFLGVGAQASTQREIQMLSLPITMFQTGMLGLSLASASQPGSTLALIAEVFPFSSPFAMAARAANVPELWPHFAALAWQALWVSVVIALGARWFRRGVLQSGSPKLRLRRFPRRG